MRSLVGIKSQVLEIFQKQFTIYMGLLFLEFKRTTNNRNSEGYSDKIKS